MDNYKEVEDFYEATHWIAEDDENNGYSGVTVGKTYELKLDENEQEHYIIDDRGLSSLIFLIHEGKLIKKITA